MIEDILSVPYPTRLVRQPTSTWTTIPSVTAALVLTGNQSDNRRELHDKMKARGLFGLSDEGRFLVWKSVDVDPKSPEFEVAAGKIASSSSGLQVHMWPSVGSENLEARGRATTAGGAAFTRRTR